MKTRSGTWTFDESVAKRFNREALCNIPDYLQTINQCVEIAKLQMPFNAQILDIGSALGTTVDAFLNAGFKNVFGTEKSQAMIKYSLHQDRIINSEVIPSHYKWDMILLNWTLHFIKERKQFLYEVFNQMNYSGILILSDKMNFNEKTQKQYIQFKRDNGMSDDEIQNKQLALDGVLTTKPLSWYFDTLEEIGFKNVKVINSRFMFNTIYAEKGAL